MSAQHLTTIAASLSLVFTKQPCKHNLRVHNTAENRCWWWQREAKIGNHAAF